MKTVKIVVWQEEDAWIGYLQDYPDYRTQGSTLKDLRAHLQDLHRDITSGKIPGLRRVEKLMVS